MKMGVHRKTLAAALTGADKAWVYQPAGLEWDLAAAMDRLPSASVCENVDAIVAEVVGLAQPGDTLVVMSNGGFDNIYEKLEAALTR